MFVPYFGYNFFPGFKKYLLGSRGFFGAGIHGCASTMGHDKEGRKLSAISFKLHGEPLSV